VCPTTRYLEFAGGRVEGRIAQMTGDALFGTFNRNIIGLLTLMHMSERDEALHAASLFAQYMFQETGMIINKTQDEILEEVLSVTDMRMIPTKGLHVALKDGGSIAAPSGPLRDHGIRVVILTNTSPPDEGKFKINDMVGFTRSALQAAETTTIDSLTIPAIGTGNAASQGYGLSDRESAVGFFLGCMDYVDRTGGQSYIRRIDYNMFADVTPEEARKKIDFLNRAGVFGLLANRNRR
jgi:hypothetical protein